MWLRHHVVDVGARALRRDVDSKKSPDEAALLHPRQIQMAEIVAFEKIPLGMGLAADKPQQDVVVAIENRHQIGLGHQGTRRRMKLGRSAQNRTG